MSNLPLRTEENRSDDNVSINIVTDFHWSKIRLGFVISIILTLAAGIPLMVAFDNAWWLAWTGVLSLFIGAIVTSRLAGTGELLNGAAIALLYFTTVALIYMVGQALEFLPDPLPGLPADDSTFFFVWPLAQIIAGTIGSFVGGIRRKNSGGK